MISSTHFHAMVVHFPIALLMVGFLSEWISIYFNKNIFRQFTFYLLMLGTLGSIVSYLAGLAAGGGMDEGALNTAMKLHKQTATISLLLTITTSLVYIGMIKYNKVWLRIAGLLFFTSAVLSIARTGYLGGQLVYKHGAGVELALPDFSKQDEK